MVCSQRPVEILDGLFFVERGYLNGNHFVYRCDEPVLIDTGYASGVETTERVITNLGVDISRVKLIVNTHCHCDHVGGNRKIQQESGCDIAMHAIGKHFIDTRDAWSTWWSYYVQEAEFFQCTRGLRDGDVIVLGPHEFKVIYTPGHSADGIVLYNSANKLLLSSDTLWERDLAVITVRVEGSRAIFSMLESLDRIEQLEVKTVYPGHGRPFTDVAAALTSSRKRLHDFLENPKRMGNDLLKKIIVYTLMMKRSVDEDSFFDYLMTTPWFVETVDHYFNGEYERKYRDVIKKCHGRGIIKCRDGRMYTTVKP